MHPYNTRDDLIALCQKNGIVVNSYSPLGGKGNEDQVGLGWQGICAGAVFQSVTE